MDCAASAKHQHQPLATPTNCAILNFFKSSHEKTVALAVFEFHLPSLHHK